MKIPNNFKRTWASLPLAIEEGKELFALAQAEVLIIEIKYGSVKLDTEYRIELAGDYSFVGERIIKQRINHTNINIL